MPNAPQNNSFAASFMHLRLRRELRKITERWELDYRIVNKIMCFLEGGYGLFQKGVNLPEQKQWTGFA